MHIVVTPNDMVTFICALILLALVIIGKIRSHIREGNCRRECLQFSFTFRLCYYSRER